MEGGRGTNIKKIGTHSFLARRFFFVTAVNNSIVTDHSPLRHEIMGSIILGGVAVEVSNVYSIYIARKLGKGRKMSFCNSAKHFFFSTKPPRTNGGWRSRNFGSDKSSCKPFVLTWTRRPRWQPPGWLKCPRLTAPKNECSTTNCRNT